MSIDRNIVGVRLYNLNCKVNITACCDDDDDDGARVGASGSRVTQMLCNCLSGSDHEIGGLVNKYSRNPCAPQICATQ